MIVIVILMGILALALGSLIGYFIATKTSWVEKFSSANKNRDKILNNPELLKEKIEESYRKLNPEAEGKLKIVDMGKVIDLKIEEKEGKKILVFEKSDYIPPKEKNIPGTSSKTTSNKKKAVKKKAKKKVVEKK